jgi:hypothetical protein
MTDQILPSRLRRGAVVLLAALLAALGIAVANAPAASAAGAQVSVSPGTADPDYATTLQLNGSGFQSIQNGFGGIYVLFGWVDTTWRPSQGGASGVNFVYVQDTETKDNHGFQKFISYPGDPTSYAANGGEVHADGTWSTTLNVPGAVFPAKGRSGGIEQIDCRKVSCGVITIGGHGVVSPNNETFTPVSFAVPAQNAPAPVVTQAAPTAVPTPAPIPPPAAAPTAAPTSAAGLSIPTHTAAVPSSAAAAKDAAAQISASPVASTRTSSSPIGWLIGAVLVLIVGGGAGRWWLRRRGRGAQA